MERRINGHGGKGGSVPKEQQVGSVVSPDCFAEPPGLWCLPHVMVSPNLEG